MKAFLFITLFTFLSFAYGQQYNFTNFSVSDGLAQSQVYDVLEDRRGYLWMATQGGGISRFDGANFKNYAEKDGLLSNFISSFVEGVNGDILIATSKGLSIFNGKSFQNFCLDENCTISVQKIILSQNGKVLLATSNGLYTFHDESFENVYSLEQKYLQTLFEDAAENIWTCTKDKLYLISKDSLSVQKMDNNCDQDINTIVQDDSLNIWIGTFGSGLCRYKNGVFATPTFHKDLKGARILDLFYESGNLWIATIDKGLAKCDLKNQTCIFLKEEDGLANNNVRSIQKDRLGNIWIGTSGGGVSKYSGEEFINYNRSIGLSGNYIYAVASGTANEIYVASSGLGVQCIQENKISELAENSALSNVKVKSILVDRDSLIWCGTEGQGVFLVKKDSIIQHFLPSKISISGAWVNRIIEDDEGVIWLASIDGGISKVTKVESRFSFENYKGNKIANNNVASLALDQQNRMWYATRYGGVSYLTPSKPSVVYKEGNLLRSNNFRSILIDSLNYLWLGSVSEGLAYANLNEDSLYFKFLTTEEGLASNNVYQLNLDADQNLWVGTQKGLDKISLDADRNILELHHFSIEEGFIGVETNQNASCLDQKGNLWFGTVNGLTKYTPGNSIINSIAPKLVIQEISLFYEALENTPYAKMLNSWNKFQEKVTFPYNQNHLSFDFIGINLSNPSKVSYQWKLDDFDEDWSPVSSKNSATYSNIPSGDYVFQVKASNEDQVWSEAEAFPFEVSKAFWMNWYFQFGVIALIVGLLSLFIYFRIKRIKQDASLKSEMISLEQKAMQLQMNPHFVFNTLNSIQGLIAENNNKDARLQLAKFSRLMRAILENSLEVKIPLDKEVATLKNYLELEQSIQNEAFSYEIVLEEVMDPSFIELPSMLLQPFIENAILHGVKTKGKDGLISIYFKQKEEELEVVIQDNGIGRQAAEALKKKQKPFHISTALEVTEKRLNNLSSRSNPLEIVDLYDVNGEALGTKILLLIPLS